MPVHLFGQIAPMRAACAQSLGATGMTLIEDAAQAQGARADGARRRLRGRAPGPASIRARTSAPTATPAPCSPTDEIAKQVRALRNYGSEVKYHHPETGFNSRLDTLQAVVLRAKLPAPRRLERERRAAAAALRRAARGHARRDAARDPARQRAHLAPLRRPRAATATRCSAGLNEAGIGAGIHYPVPIHLQGAFRHLGHTRRRISRSPSAPPARSSRCRCSPRSPPSSSSGWRTRSGRR